ncbi:MAG: HAD-IC family P-type ATPase, partial [Candidatus Eremiobacterota bacterium]
RTALFLAVDGALLAVLLLADTPRPEARATVDALKEMGLEVWMLTGDQEATARSVAAGLGISHVRAQVLPADKVAVIRELKEGGQVVAMVGDGINDAPALAEAHLGVSMGTGTDVALAASDVTLVGGLNGLVTAIALSRKTVDTIRQGLFWAFAYNVLLIPVAMGLLYPLTGTLLSPTLAAGAMATSSVTVVTNALRLRSWRRPARPADILHPPLPDRIRDYAYLALVGITGVLVALLAAYLAPAGHSM